MNFKFKILSLFLILSFSFNSCYAEPEFVAIDKLEAPHFSSGEPYSAVREKLINEGWSPVISPDSYVCIDGDVRCANRPEMEACSGSGLAPCKFVWSKDGYNLNVFTVGVDATDEGDAAFDSLEIVDLHSKK